MFPKPGYFVDVGAADAQNISNTVSLEQHGWRGICIDPFPRNFETRPSCILEPVAVYSSETEVDFLHSDRGSDIGGIEKHLGLTRHSVLSFPDVEKIKVQTALLQNLLVKHDAPPFIEYLNLDIEGAELEVLRVFPFNKYTFGCLTIEHNFEEPKRSLIRELLNLHGYKLFQSVQVDDWYVHDDYSFRLRQMNEMRYI